MQFTYPIEVEPNTTAVEPERLQIKLCVGIIKKASIYFPWGCAGLVGVRVLHYEHQLYPTNSDEWYTGNEILIEFEDEYPIWEGPNEFKLEAYNLDDFYPHIPIVSFNIVRSGMYAPELLGGMEA
ncbi:MAG: hypothetical protein KKB38_20755 [Gammaproteobacteria bacterium]|nr:hypothetical protein [Gammaproteobacteria bacterium]